MKWFKRLLLAALLLVVFVVLAMIGIVVLVDPNDYRDEIATAVKQQTGRDLIIEGELDLSVFPWLGLELGRVRLDNPPGFTGEVFAAVEHVNIKVALLPLLRLETRVGDLELDGLKINLERRADGVTNWDDLAAKARSKPGPEETPQASEQPAPEQARPTAPVFYVGGLDISDTDISWRDGASKVYTRIEDLNFTTGEVLPLKSIPFKLEFSVRNDSPKLLAGAKLEGAARMDLAGEQYTLENLDLNVEASGTMVPGGNQSLLMQLPKLTLNTRAQTAAIEQLKMQLAGLSLTLDLQAQSVSGENPQVSGQLTANTLQLRSFMQALGIEAPLTTDPTALGFLNAQLAFKGDAKSFATENLKVTFDETNITGALALDNFDAPAYRVNLNVDKLNVDRYMTPPEPAHVPAKEEPATDPEIPLPVDDLRALKAEGALKFGELQLMKLKLSNLNAALKAADGIVRLEPLSVDLYSGNFQGAVTLDVTGATPQYKIASQVSQVQIEPLLFDYMQSRFISGQMNAKFDISTAGGRLSEFKKNLSGLGNLNFRDGALSIDLREKAREAKAKLKREAYNAPPPKPTTFSAITAGLDFNRGTVANKDLEVRAGHMFITGAGQYALPTDAIDYVVTLLISEDPMNQDQSLAEFHDLPIKLHLKGKLATLDYMDIVKSGLTGAVGAKVKKEVQEKTDAVKQELQQRLQEKLGVGKPDEQSQQAQPSGDESVEQKKQEKIDELREKLRKKLER